MQKEKQNQIYVDFSNTIKTKVWWYQKLLSPQSRVLQILWRIIRLIGEFLFISWLVITITFFLINSVPGSTGLTSGLDEATKRSLEIKYGLNEPIGVRYGRYLEGLFYGQLGVSLSVLPGQEINDFIWLRFLKSFYVGIFAVGLTLVLGIPLGVYVGRNPGKLLDHITTVVISVFTAFPSLVLALLLLLAGRAIGLPYIFNDQQLVSYILPGLALSLGSVIVYIKYIRAELHRELGSMHAKFCYLKGISKSQFVWKHALKPSLFPIATFFPAVIFGAFIGSIFVEQIFFITGSGGILVNAIVAKDYNIILFLVVLFSLITILSYTFRDILYEIIDPRIRRKRA